MTLVRAKSPGEVIYGEVISREDDYVIIDVRRVEQTDSGVRVGETYIAERRHCNSVDELPSDDRLLDNLLRS